MDHHIPYWLGISGEPLKYFDVRGAKTKWLKKLLSLQNAEMIVWVCKHYLTHFIPDPIANENEDRIMSCSSSTDQSPVRVSIWFPEVFNIPEPWKYFGRADELQCRIFVHAGFFTPKTIQQLENKIEGLHFQRSYRFLTGIEDQLTAFMPLKSYFVSDEAIFESIQTHNFGLSLKGRTPLKKDIIPHSFDICCNIRILRQLKIS